MDRPGEEVHSGGLPEGLQHAIRRVISKHAIRRMISKSNLEKRYIVEDCLKESNALSSNFRTEERRASWFRTLVSIVVQASSGCR